MELLSLLVLISQYVEYVPGFYTLSGGVRKGLFLDTRNNKKMRKLIELLDFLCYTKTFS